LKHLRWSATCAVAGMPQISDTAASRTANRVRFMVSLSLDMGERRQGNR
jgi:hypothetical protein